MKLPLVIKHESCYLHSELWVRDNNSKVIQDEDLSLAGRKFTEFSE